ncbi:Negative elongation factor C/D [Chytridiales sp. JEL 0842]|nr:Negative elongation factor C/D [Chytridiales sp. JEL 0842]
MAMNDLDNFTDKLIRFLSDLAASSDVSVTADLKELHARESLLLSEQEYLYFRALLVRLQQESVGDKRTGKLLKRIADEIDQCIGFSENHDPFREAFKFSGSPTFTDLVVSITKILTGEVQSSDIQKVYNMYTSEKPPSPEYLRQARFFDVLLKEIGFGGAAKPNLVTEKIWLLAYASSVRELPDGSLDKSLLESTANAIDSLRQHVARLNPSLDMRDEFLGFVNAMEYPIAAEALLRWLETTINDPTFYESSVLLNGTETPLLFELMDEIAIRVQLQRQAILKVIESCLLRSYDTIEIKKRYMVKVGYVVPVLNMIPTIVDDLDASLPIYFMREVVSHL